MEICSTHDPCANECSKIAMSADTQEDVIMWAGETNLSDEVLSLSSMWGHEVAQMYLFIFENKGIITTANAC